MKTNLITFCTFLIIFSLTIFGSVNKTIDKTVTKNTSKTKFIAANLLEVYPLEKLSTEKKTFDDFIYDVGTRFSPIKKSTLRKATSVHDFFDKHRMKSVVNVTSVNIIIVKNDRQTDIRDIGYSSTLTATQLQLLKSFEYSSNFLVGMTFTEKIKGIDVLVDNYDTPYLTVVPEKQAEYYLGKEALKEHLRYNSLTARKEANVETEKLSPAKLYFTVTKLGTIKNVRLDRSSNYSLVDKTMIKLIMDTATYWIPAENENGEKVDQELVISFGLMGC